MTFQKQRLRACLLSFWMFVQFLIKAVFVSENRFVKIFYTVCLVVHVKFGQTENHCIDCIIRLPDL